MILGISASPHKGGKVETLVQEVLSASRLPSEMVRLHDISVGPCKACNGCWANNKCVIMDGKEYRYGWLSYLRCLWGCGGMVMGDRFYALSDLPMPKIDDEGDFEQIMVEFLLAGEDRFPWDRATRGAFAYNACSKCYVVCHPEKLKQKNKVSN